MMRLDIPNVFFDIFDAAFDDESAAKKSPKRSRSYSGCPRVGRRHCRPSAFQPSSLNKWFEAIAKQQEAEDQKAEAKTEPKLTTTIVKSDVFAHSFDVQSFEPSEISVKMDGDTLVVSGKHEHTFDDGQYELREYVRKLKVPENVLVEQMKCKLDEKTGQLQIEAPLRKPEEEKPAERTIPIEFVKKPVAEPEKDMALD